VTKRVLFSAGAVAVTLSAVFAPVALAEPAPAPPSPVPGSTDDELADMVLDAISHGTPDPGATAVPAPRP
jgi:hypothetical protein